MNERCWTAWEDAQLRHLDAAGWTVPPIARLLQRTETAVYVRRRRIGLAATYHQWTKAEDRRLATMGEEGIPVPIIAKALNRSEGAIVKRKSERGIRIDSEEYLSIDGVAKAMGVSWSTVDWWVKAGALTTRRRRVSRERLELLVQTERFWPRFEVERIVDPFLRDLAREARHGLVFYSVAQVAQFLGYCAGSIINFIHDLRLKAQRGRGMAYLVRSDWLEEATVRLRAAA